MFQRFWMTMLVLLASAQALAAPTVSLTAPAANSSYTSPATITLTAEATSSDGTIVQVAFYDGQALIGSTTSAPYTLDWPGVGAGTYQLTAVATDSLNITATSAPVTVTVTAAAPAQQVYYIHSDHLNTPRLITDQNNNAVWQWDSDPFGTTVANEDPNNTGSAFAFNPRFPGQYFDRETGLHYNYFRDYDPLTGRYLQSDPIGLDGGLNTYAYVEGNPISYIDPLGLSKFDKWWGLPKEFQNWAHRQDKGKRGYDYSEQEAKELYEDWLKQGKPKPDGKRRHRQGGFADLGELFIPFLWTPTEMGCATLDCHPEYKRPPEPICR